MRETIVLNSLLWLDTPYHHYARLKGVGVDCAQLVAGVAESCGMITEKDILAIPHYSVQWHLHNDEERLLDILKSYGCEEKDKMSVLPGDIITFRFGRVTSHLGIMIDKTQFIHARYDVKKVVINTLSGDWEKRWTHTYKFPGVVE